jgi:hypothetical protein
VLKKLNRPAWTWVTTTGWVLLITTGAIFLGSVMKSGDLHYRTVRVIDQADGQVVAATDVLGIYSPRTQAYGIDGHPTSWWAPSQAQVFSPWSRQRSTTEIAFEQDRNGQRPLMPRDPDGKPMPTMIVNVWNLRFLEGEVGDASSQTPVLAASLKRVGEVGKSTERITGTITNLSDRPLKNIRIRTFTGTSKLTPAREDGQPRENAAEIAEIAAKQTVRINSPVVPAAAEPQSKQDEYLPSYYGGPNVYDREGDTNLAFQRAACDLAAQRTTRLNELLSRRKDMAVITAESDGNTPIVKLIHNTGEAKEQHWRVVRALVKVD